MARSLRAVHGRSDPRRQLAPPAVRRARALTVVGSAALALCAAGAAFLSAGSRGSGFGSRSAAATLGQGAEARTVASAKGKSSQKEEAAPPVEKDRTGPPRSDAAITPRTPKDMGVQNAYFPLLIPAGLEHVCSLDQCMAGGALWVPGSEDNLVVFRGPELAWAGASLAGLLLLAFLLGVALRPCVRCVYRGVLACSVCLRPAFAVVNWVLSGCAWLVRRSRVEPASSVSAPLPASSWERLCFAALRLVSRRRRISLAFRHPQSGHRVSRKARASVMADPSAAELNLLNDLAAIYDWAGVSGDLRGTLATALGMPTKIRDMVFVSRAAWDLTVGSLTLAGATAVSARVQVSSWERLLIAALRLISRRELSNWSNYSSAVDKPVDVEKLSDKCQAYGQWRNTFRLTWDLKESRANLACKMGERTYPVLAAVGAAAERRLGWTKALLWMSMSFPNCVAQASGGAAVEWAGAHFPQGRGSPSGSRIQVPAGLGREVKSDSRGALGASLGNKFLPRRFVTTAAVSRPEIFPVELATENRIDSRSHL
ncbi:unnamed protein product [Polarella glacialis]|uniref:Uncharacterized protein n=1 Tax=Polarella glacialis TaxID=89957 RepID=A0A813IF47_POLGL|nr:unnamed protein product [Polarella glacialis]